MKAAIIAVEDRRFYTEGGVDLQGMLRAAVNDSTGGSLQGASTIPQQYVKNYLVNVVDRTDPGGPGRPTARTRRAQAARSENGRPAQRHDEQGRHSRRLPERRGIQRNGVRRRRRGESLLRDHSGQTDRSAGRVARRNGEQPERLQPVHASGQGAAAAQPRHRRHGHQRLPPRVLRGDGEGGPARAAAERAGDAVRDVHGRGAGRRVLLRLRGKLPGARRVHRGPARHRRLHDQDDARPPRLAGDEGRRRRERADHAGRRGQHLRRRAAGLDRATRCSPWSPTGTTAPIPRRARRPRTSSPTRATSSAPARRSRSSPRPRRSSPARRAWRRRCPTRTASASRRRTPTRTPRATPSTTTATTPTRSASPTGSRRHRTSPSSGSRARSGCPRCSTWPTSWGCATPSRPTTPGARRTRSRRATRSTTSRSRSTSRTCCRSPSATAR